MERRNATARTYLRPRSPDRQTLIEALVALDKNNLVLSVENAYLVEQTIHLLESHAEKRDKLNETVADMKKTLETYKDQMKDRCEEFLSLLKNYDALVTKIIETQDFQMEELKNSEAASPDQPEVVGSERNTHTDDALQKIQIFSKLNQIQKKLNEKNEMISNLRAENEDKARRLICMNAKLILAEAELDQSIKETNALEQKFKDKLARREESWNMRKNVMERLWLENEGTLKERVSKAEEGLKQVIIQNIKLQELALEKKEPRLWPKKRQENRNTDEEEEDEEEDEEEGAAAYPAQARHKEKKEKEKQEKEGEKVKIWGFWRKKNNGEKRQQVEEAAAGLDQPGQEERQAEEKPKKRGFWNMCRKKKEVKAQTPEKEEEGAACPETEEQ